jgi:hypothetical protein
MAMMVAIQERKNRTTEAIPTTIPAIARPFVCPATGAP